MHRRNDTGRLGERIAAERLERRGYRVLERNYRRREGEIDLIATRRPVLVFCEVKTLIAASGSRPGPVHPLEAVRPAKRAQIRRLARAWLAERSNAAPGCRDLRFDAIGVLLSTRGELLDFRHVESAF